MTFKTEQNKTVFTTDISIGEDIGLQESRSNL